MTSREALEELYELALFDSICDPDDCKRCTAIKVCGSYQYYKTIKKDLEVLEIIKNKLVYPLALMSLPYELYNNSVIKEQQLTKEEYELLKEWLKNDK